MASVFKGAMLACGLTLLQGCPEPDGDTTSVGVDGGDGSHASQAEGGLVGEGRLDAGVTAEDGATGQDADGETATQDGGGLDGSGEESGAVEDDAGPQGDAGSQMDSGSQMDAGSLDAQVGAPEQATVLWHTFFGADDATDHVNGLARDSEGNLYLAGSSEDGWLGPAGQAPLSPHPGPGAALVMKVSAEGAYLWHAFFASSRYDAARAIAVDADDHVIVTGNSAGSWAGPAGQAPLNDHSGPGLSGSGGTQEDLFVLKLDADGGYVWHTFLGRPDSVGDDDYGRSVIVDGDRNIFVAGEGSPFLGPDGELPERAHGGGSTLHKDAFVLSLDAGGDYRWHTFLGASNGDDRAVDLAFDGDGDLLVLGRSELNWVGPLSWWDFEAGLPRNPHNELPEGWEPYDVFVAKLSASGAYRWHTFMGCPVTDTVHGLAVDSQNEVVVVGSSQTSWRGPDDEAPLYAGAGPEEALRAGDEDPPEGLDWDFNMFVTKLDADGYYVWHAFFGQGLSPYWRPDIAVDSTDALLVVGDSREPWLGPGGEAPHNPARDKGDIQVLKLGSEGDYRFHTYLGAEGGGDTARVAELDGDGILYLGGYAAKNYSSPEGAAPLNAHTPEPNADIALVKMALPAP